MNGEEWLTPEELKALPEIEALAEPGERVPRGAELVARKMELTEDDLLWVTRSISARRKRKED